MATKILVIHGPNLALLGEREVAVYGNFTLDEINQQLLAKAAEGAALTARGWTRTLRLARTIADLEGAETVRRVHVAEALAYRRTTTPGEESFAPMTRV